LNYTTGKWVEKGGETDSLDKRLDKIKRDSDNEERDVDSD